MSYEHIFSIGPDDLEDVHYYRQGLFHPVEINDTFKGGRYVVLHKLGHGGFSTVWLAHDTQAQVYKYVALKILGAHGSRNVNEIAVHKWLSKCHDSFDSTMIANLLDYFAFNGPNGRHIGLVFEAHGPSIAALMEAGIKIRPDFMRTISKQIASLVKNCHDNNIAIGDLSTKNILLEFENVQDWSITDIYNHFGPPNPWKMVPMNKNEQFPTCGPKNLYPSVKVNDSAAPFIKPKVVLADLNDVMCTEEGVEKTVQPGSLCINTQFAGPELVLSLERRHTKPLDIWALASVFYNIRTMDTLIHGGGFSGGSDLYEVQQLLGEIPESLKAKIRAAETDWEQYCKETKEEPSGYLPVPFLQPDERDADASLHERLAAVGTWSKFHSLTIHQKIRCILETTSALDRRYTLDLNLNSDPYAAPPPAKFSDEELEDFEDLLSRMLKYAPEERLTISEVLEHPWLNKDYQYLDDLSTPWLVLCTGGWQYVDLDEWYEEVIVKDGAWQQSHHPGMDSDDEGHDVDSDSRTELEDGDSQLEQENCLDSSLATLDMNTWPRENLEHIFVWQRKVTEIIREDDEVEMQSVSLSRNRDDDSKVQNPNAIEFHNLEHVFVGQHGADHIQMSDTNIESNECNTYRNRAEAIEATLIDSNDCEQQRRDVASNRQREEREKVQLQVQETESRDTYDPGHIYMPQMTEDVVINHDQDKGTEATQSKSTKHHSFEKGNLEQTGRNTIMDLDQGETEDIAEWMPMHHHNLDNVQIWRRGRLPWEVQGLNPCKGQDEGEAAANLILARYRKREPVYMWRREASIWEVQALSREAHHGTVSFMKVVWNRTSQLDDDID